MTRIAAAAFLIVALGACSAPRALREDTRILGLYVQTVKADAEEFARLRDASTRARLANIAALELKTLRSEQAVQQDLQALELARDEQRLHLLKSLQNASSILLVQRRDYEAKSAQAKKEVENAKSALNFRFAQLSQTSATLVKLGEATTLREDMRFYAHFLGQLRRQLDNDKAEVKAATSDAAARVSQKAAENAPVTTKGE